MQRAAVVRESERCGGWDWVTGPQSVLLPWCFPLNPYPSSQLHDPGHLLCCCGCCCCIAHTPITLTQRCSATKSHICCNLHRVASYHKAFIDTITELRKITNNWFSKTAIQTSKKLFNSSLFGWPVAARNPFLYQFRNSYYSVDPTNQLTETEPKIGACFSFSTQSSIVIAIVLLIAVYFSS